MKNRRKIKSLTISTVILLGLFYSNSSMAQLFVNINAKGLNDGSSWENAYSNLQEALNATKEGNQIWVASGTYFPGKSGDPKTTTYHITQGLKLYGGFAGIETELSERDLSKHPTILSGDLNQDDIANDFETNRSDNVQTILTIENNTITLPIVDGFTFKGGHANGENSLTEASCGGALFLYGPALVRNCSFNQNFSKERAGALFLMDSLAAKNVSLEWGKTDFIIENCDFNNNYSTEGGAVNIRLKKGKISSLLIQHSNFLENRTKEYGGGLAVQVLGDDVNLKIDSCHFFKNQSANSSAAIHCEIFGKNNRITTQSSTLSENLGIQSCGAVLLFTSDSSATNLYTISDCEFVNNRTDEPEDLSLIGGGAIYSRSKGISNATVIQRSNFSKNNTKGVGGAICVIHSDDGKNSQAKVYNCRFDTNSSDNGGALYYISDGKNDSLWIQQCNFAENSISELHPGFATMGGAVHLNYHSDAHKCGAFVKACTFENNQAKGGSGGALAISPNGQEVFVNISSSTFIANKADKVGGAFFYNGLDTAYKLVNCTFGDNQAIEGGAEFYQPESFGKRQFYIFFHAVLWFQILYSLLLFLIVRERTSLYYALMLFGISLFFVIVFDAIHFPILKEFSGNTKQMLYQIGVFFSIFGLIKFAQKYLNINQLIPRFKKAVFYFLGFFLFVELIFCFRQFDLLGQVGENTRGLVNLLLMFCFFIGSLIPAVWAIIALRKGSRPAKYFLLAMLFYGAALSWLVISFFQSGSPLAIPIIYIECLLLLSITTLALADGYRINLLKKERERAERLSELDAAKTRLYTNITHEFRTPLTVIMGATDLVKGNESEKNLIKRNSKQLLQLINQMLDLSKLEGGALKLESQQGNIIPFTEYLVESFQSMADSKQVRLTFYRELDELQMDYDAEKMQQIISNLLSNAIKFTAASGKVIVHAKEEIFAGKPYLTLAVRDNGAGIAEEDIPHVFDRFFQVDASDLRHSEGSGIGLALVKELVELMNGQIEVTSKVGDGTVFTVRIPISKLAPLQSEAIDVNELLLPEVLNEEKETTSPFQPLAADLPLALIIEDNKDIVSFLRSCLQRKYKIEVAYNGQQGIDKALDVIPDIIISDVMMPEADGFTVCKTLKTDERTSHVPIILLTAKATQEDKVQGLEVGADAYLSKPFHQDELEIRLQKLIELRQQLQQRYQGNSPSNNSPKNKEDTFLQKLKSVIQEKMEDEKFSINDLCHAVGLSRMQVHRKLKALTGMPATAFINSVRLQKAYELLSDTELNVSEVAYQVGFSNHSYFSKLFFNKFGKTPSEISNN